MMSVRNTLIGAGLVVAGKAGDDDVTSSESFDFRKEATPKLVELVLADGARVELGGR